MYTKLEKYYEEARSFMSELSERPGHHEFEGTVQEGGLRKTRGQGITGKSGLTWRRFPSMVHLFVSEIPIKS